ARVVAYEPNYVAIETNCSRASLLVVSEIFYPGWEAWVDGQPTSIFVTDYLLRGVALSKGNHRVEMRYRAPGARRGAYVTGLSLLLFIGLFVYSRVSRKKSAQPLETVS